MALQARQRFVASLADVFSRVDLLAQASSPTVAPQLGEALGPAAQALHRLAWTNYGGCCAASVPVGHADGLPIGLHLAAAPGTDALLLAACAALEGLQSGRPMAINLVCR
jgi:aspartyl-tRNA(Asn)/glutamyl-tRNA(Gln) amidotransferase subunit A